MTWSISKSGPVAEVTKYLEELDVPTHLDDAEANDFEGAATFAILAIANHKFNVGVSASGHRSGSTMTMSTSISAWNPDPEPQEDR